MGTKSLKTSAPSIQLSAFSLPCWWISGDHFLAHHQDVSRKLVYWLHQGDFVLRLLLHRQSRTVRGKGSSALPIRNDAAGSPSCPYPVSSAMRQRGQRSGCRLSHYGCERLCTRRVRQHVGRTSVGADRCGDSFSRLSEMIIPSKLS